MLPRRALLQPESVRTHAAETDDLYVNLLVKGGPAHLSGNIVRPHAPFARRNARIGVLGVLVLSVSVYHI